MSRYSTPASQLGRLAVAESDGDSMPVQTRSMRRQNRRLTASQRASQRASQQEEAGPSRRPQAPQQPRPRDSPSDSDKDSSEPDDSSDDEATARQRRARVFSVLAAFAPHPNYLGPEELSSRTSTNFTQAESVNAPDHSLHRSNLLIDPQPSLETCGNCRYRPGAKQSRPTDATHCAATGRTTMVSADA